MILTIDQVHTYTKHYFSSLSDTEFQEKQTKFIENLSRFDDQQWIFYHLGSKNQFVSCHVQKDHGNAYIIFVTAHRNFYNENEFIDVFNNLCDEIIDFMEHKFHFFSLESRCLRGAEISSAYGSTKLSLSHTRYEYKKDLTVDSLFTSEKIRFDSYANWGLSLEQVAEIMTNSAIGDPDFSEDEDALECLQSYLNDPYMYSKDDCIQLGKVDDEYVCLVVPQSEGTWGTLTYLGVIPAYRNRGLGRELHRYGLSCLYKQGTREYNGGTLETNTGMQRVFEKNDCKLYRYLEVWFYKSA